MGRGRREIGRAVADYRRRNDHMSQERLAAAAGVTRVTLSKVERGDPRVQLRTLEAVMRAAGLASWIDAPGAGLTDDELMAAVRRRGSELREKLRTYFAEHPLPSPPPPGVKPPRSATRRPSVTRPGETPDDRAQPDEPAV